MQPLPSGVLCRCRAECWETCWEKMVWDTYIYYIYKKIRLPRGTAFA